MERGRCKFISWYHCCGIDNRFDVLVLAKLYRCSFFSSWSCYPIMCSSKAWNVRKGGKRSLPFLLAVWGLGGRRFRVRNIRRNFVTIGGYALFLYGMCVDKYFWQH